MKTETARIAFVGAGEHATESLYPNIPQIPAFRLVAVCDLDANKAEHFAERYAADAYTQVEKMLDDVGPDGVCICGPPNMHFEVAKACLSRGLPVFVEKPPATESRSCQELIETALAHETFAMVGFQKRFAPSNLVAKKVMSKMEFGVLSTVSLIHGSGPYDDLLQMMLFNGIHMVDLASFLGGEIASVSALVASCGERQGLVISFTYTSGAVGTLNMNSGHHWKDCYEAVYISGTGTAVSIDASKSCEIMSTDRQFAEVADQELFGWSGRYYVSGNMAGWWAGSHYTRGYWGELDHFAKACLGQVEPTPTLADSFTVLRFIERSLASAERNGEPVDLI